MAEGRAGLSQCPAMLKRVITDRAWECRMIPERDGEVVHFDTFLDFVHHHPYQGLGADVPTLRRICEGDREALEMLDGVDGVLKKGPGGNNNPQGANQHVRPQKEVTLDIVQGEHAPSGNSSGAGRRRLAKHRPDLSARVRAGELSVNAAMIEAGFRKKPTNLEVALRAYFKLTPAEVKDFTARIAR